MLRMVAPALPESPEGQQRAGECANVEGEAKQAVLAHDLEIDAVRVKGLVVVRSEVEGPDIRVPEGSEASAREGMTDRDVPRGLERLQTTHRGHVPRLDRLLLRDGAETLPESLGGEG